MLDLKMDHERAREMQDQEKRKLLEKMKEVTGEEVETSRPVPSPRVHDETKRWTPQKEAAIVNTRNTLFSSQNQEKVNVPKKTDEMRGAVSGNMSKLEQTHTDLNKRLSTMGLESDQEGEGTMLSLTTHLATKYPDLLDGDYETRLLVLSDLTQTSGEILERKSRRLADLTPEKIETWRISSEKERKQVQIEMSDSHKTKEKRPTGFLGEQMESSEY